MACYKAVTGEWLLIINFDRGRYKAKRLTGLFGSFAMMIIRYFFIFSTIFPFLAHGQDTTIIIRQANLLAGATFKGDIKTIVAYTYPGLIQLSGGKEKFQQLVTDRMSKLKYQGINKIDGVIGSPGKFYIAGNQVHCLLPEDIYLSTFAGRYKSRSYLLGVSEDKGANWTFLDVGNMPPGVLRKLLPDFNSRLIIPQPSKPEFLAN